MTRSYRTPEKIERAKGFRRMSWMSWLNFKSIGYVYKRPWTVIKEPDFMIDGDQDAD